MKKLLLCFLLVAAAAFSQTADVYVSNLGSDATGTGTFSNPYQTVDKARQAIDAIVSASGCGGGGRSTPYVVDLMGVPAANIASLPTTGLGAGTFYQGATTLTKSLSFTASDNGCVGFPVIYQSYPGTVASISGGIRVTGWQSTGYTCGGTCVQYSVTLSSTQPYFEDLWYNGVRRFRSRLGASSGNSCGSSGATCPNIGQYYRAIGEITANWQASFTYVAGDITTRSGTTYIALQTSLNVAPPNASYWAAYSTSYNPIVVTTDPCTGCGSSPNPTANTGCTVFPSTSNCIDRLRYGTVGSPSVSQWNNILVPAAGLTYAIASNGVSLTSDVVTVNTASGNVARVGQQVTLAGLTGCTNVSNGLQTLPISAITGTSISFPLTASNQSACGGSSATIVTQDPQNDVEMQYWEDYTSPRLRIAGVDTTSGEQIISFNGNFNSNSEGNYGPLASHRFIIENEQDDATHFILLPQQWFLNRSSGRPWTLYYNALPTENPNNDTVEIPWMPQTLVANALQYVTFRNILFKEDSFLIPENSYIDSQGEPNIPGAVDCQNCQNVTYEYDGFTNTTGDALEIIPCVDATSVSWCTAVNGSAVNANIRIQHNAFWECASMCIQIGNQNQASDTDTNVPHLVSVIDNVWSGWGRTIPGAFGMNVGDANTLYVAHNDGTDGYHSAYSGCIPSCANGTSNSHGMFDVSIFYNHFRNCMEGVTDDGGCLYSAHGGGNGGTESGTAVRIWNNLVHDVSDPSAIGTQEPGGNGGHCIYLDNMSSNADVENNVAYRCSSSGMFLSKGVVSSGPNGPNNIVNNLFLYTRAAVLGTGTPTEWFSTADATSCANNLRQHFNFSQNIAMFDRTYLSSSVGFNVSSGCAYSCTGSYLGFQVWANNLYYKNCGTTNTCPADGGSQTASSGVFTSDNCAFHASATGNSTTQGTGGTCNNSPNNWVFGTLSQWNAGTLATNPSSCGGTGSTTIDQQSTGEDANSLGGDAGPDGTQIPWTNAGEQGYPNDNYFLTQNATLTTLGFSAAQINATLSKAGRFTNTSFLPVAVQTYPVYTFDPGHTNNGDY